MTFHIPRAYQGAVYALLVSHEALENPTGTRRCGVTAGTVVTTVFVLVAASISAGKPPTPLSLERGFSVPGVLLYKRNARYAAAVPVAVVVGVAITSWDRPLPVGANVADTLWLCLACVVGVILTAAVSSVFAAFDRRDVLIQPLADRKLSLVRAVLQCHAAGMPVPAETARQLDDAVLAGNSAWRLTLRRSGPPRPGRDRPGTTGALVARLD